ncbi:hypothetical protein RWE15_11405 [Virgibacillus halophilus]|uniref:HNH endonuclease n=1 Tax=Tigheibacillus halophilus TaxID=361280 RepID=A0ABU5C6H5_9BACI|nr:hypothetical protein [Virgibacillus halophilus]
MEKVCTICNKSMDVSYFKSSGKGKKRSYCLDCHKEKTELRHFDPNLKKKKRATALDPHSDIRVRVRVNGKIYDSTVPYEKAQTLVDHGMAEIFHSTLVHKKYEYHEFRRLVFERDHYKCRYCNGYADTIDHVIPKSKGGNQ